MWCQNPLSSSVHMWVLTCCAHVNHTHPERCLPKRIWAFMAISLSTPEPWLTALCHLSPGPGVCSLNPQLLAESLFWTDRSCPHLTLTIIRRQKDCLLLSSLPKFAIPQGHCTCTLWGPEFQLYSYRTRGPPSPTGPMLRPQHAMLFSPSRLMTESRACSLLQDQAG